jgi:hypothetical protein
MSRYTKLPRHLERIMINLLEGATITRDVSFRVQMLLVYVERALGNGNPLGG